MSIRVIEDKRKSGEVEFGSLTPNGLDGPIVFQYRKGYYLKFKIAFPDDSNTINPDTGHLAGFEYNELVIPVQVKLVVERNLA